VHALSDLRGCGVARRNLHARRLAQQALRQRADLVVEGRREQQVLPPRRQQGNQAADVADEAHVEHAIGFVEYQHVDAGQVDRALLGMIEQPSRGCDDEIDAAAQPIDLRVDAHAAEDHGAAHAQMPAVGFDRFGHLGGQFARRHQHQRPRRPRRVARETVQNGQYEGGGLAGAGLGGGEHVAPLEDQRDGLRLDRCGFGIAGVAQGAQQLRREAEILKTHARTPESPSRASLAMRAQRQRTRWRR